MSKDILKTRQLCCALVDHTKTQMNTKTKNIGLICLKRLILKLTVETSIQVTTCKELKLIPSEARGSIEIFRRRRRQPEVGLKTSISQQWCTGSLSDWQA